MPRSSMKQKQRTRQQQRTESLTISQSLQVVKNGTKAFLSSICFYRGLFETKHFRSTKYGDLDITVLSTPNPERHRHSKLSMASAKKIIDPPDKFLQWVEKGLYDMIDKQFLKEVTLSLAQNTGESTSPNASGTDRKEAGEWKTFESYTMTYDYDKDGRFTMHGRNSGGEQQNVHPINWNTSLQKQTASVIRAVSALTYTASPLPNSVAVRLEVDFNEKAPPGYQAPLFTEAFFDEETGISATFGNHVKFPTGTLSTPHCSVELNIRLLDDTLADEDMKKIVAQERRAQVVPETPVGILPTSEFKAPSSQPFATPVNPVDDMMDSFKNGFEMEDAQEQSALEDSLRHIFFGGKRRKQISATVLRGKMKKYPKDVVDAVLTHLEFHAYLIKKGKHNSATYDVKKSKTEDARKFLDRCESIKKNSSDDDADTEVEDNENMKQQLRVTPKKKIKIKKRSTLSAKVQERIVTRPVPKRKLAERINSNANKMLLNDSKRHSRRKFSAPSSTFKDFVESQCY